MPIRRLVVVGAGAGDDAPARQTWVVDSQRQADALRALVERG